jgi:cysteine desulfuration protein SufE
MLPSDKQQQLVERFLLIEDAHERMALIVDRARHQAPLSPGDRCEENRVQGCVSRVWIVPSAAEGVCHFRVDADSALVKGLAALVCEVYEGAAPREVAVFESEILSKLRLLDHLSPTRRHGLDQVRCFIRSFALSAASAAHAP